MKQIWLKGLSKRKNTMAVFRLKYKKVSGEIYLKIAAAGAFRLSINGELVGYGPRRVGQGKCALNVYDVSRFFCKNDGEITVSVAYYGNDSFYITDEQHFFACEIYSGDNLLYSAENFEAFLDERRIQKVLRYSWQRNFGEVYDLKKTIVPAKTEIVIADEIVETDLPYPSFMELTSERIEEGGVDKKEIYERADCGRSSALDALSIRFNDEELECDVVSELSRYQFDLNSDSSDRFYTYDFKKNKTGFILTHIEAENDCDIYYVFDEIENTEKVLHHSVDKQYAVKLFDETYLNGTKRIHYSRLSTINIVKYSIKKGYNELLTFEPYTMRYLRIIAVGSPIMVKKASLVLYENDDVYNYIFNPKNEKEKLVFAAAQSTLAQNSVDILTDCPSRERGGWLCDSYFSSRAEKLLTGKNRIEKNFLSSFLFVDRDDLPESMLPMVWPDDHKNGKFIPNWAMFFYLELSEYLERSGDIELIVKFRKKALRLKEYFEKFENEYGLLENLEGWLFVEWSDSNKYTYGVNFPTNMLYAEYLIALYKLYGDKSLIIKSERIKSAINRLAFNGSFYVDNAVRENGKLVLTGNVTETCQYYAFYFGTATKDNRPELYSKLFDRRDILNIATEYGIGKSNMFIGDVLRLDYLYKSGRVGDAVEECLALFGKMAERTGTLWEFEGTVASCCHAFASVCAVWLASL